MVSKPAFVRKYRWPLFALTVGTLVFFVLRSSGGATTGYNGGYPNR